MEFVLKALEGIFSIVFIIGIGFVLSRRGWFDEYSSALIARLVTAVSLPLYMIVSISKNFDHNKLVAMAPDLLLPICSMLLAFIVGKLAARIFKIKKERRGIFCTNFFIANTMFIGLPVNLALFGEKSIPAVMLYYMVNTTFFWTLGVHNIVQDTLAHTKNKPAFFSAAALKKIFSPPLAGFIIGIILVLLDWRLPHFLMNSFQYVGNLTTPLSLVFIGIEMSKIPLGEIGFDKELLLGVAGRFLVCPLCVLVLVPLLPVTTLSAQVFTMQATMPAMTQMAIVAKTYGADSAYAATLSFLTVLLGIIVVPAYMTLVSLYL
ncbi:AEC family transporter [uncultured Phascolarctobacterium sp.]|uniref:AEC family transporter n=1 Tax=uncultured Phascolarctobacterium sp. TaxID=512296 RepID=UPI0027D93A10|nr:AEC family transporter [uncultured Phascolarctobacterium sp.]